MNTYKTFVRPVLFKFDPEVIHKFTFKYLKMIQKSSFASGVVKSSFQLKSSKLEREVFGIKFPNPVGLAAGLDKNAEAFDILGKMGFGFVEIGTVTPKGQPGNDLPRLFRLKNDKALINRMGFNNDGTEKIVKRLKKRKTNVIIGGNIGKNKVTPNDKAVDDYTACFNSLYDYVDYFVVNVSSPNTPNLRELQDKEPLKRILNELMQLNSQKPAQKPILLKIAPDLSNEQLDDIIEIVDETKIAGVVATNTTIERSGLSYSESYINEIGAGGLSGKPARERSTEVIKYLYTQSDARFPIIGVGGIMTAEDAIEKLNAGASLIQVYTGFIYEGPSLIKRINKLLLKKNL